MTLIVESFQDSTPAMQRYLGGVHVREDGEIWPQPEEKKKKKKSVRKKMVHSRSDEFGDLLRFFSTLDVDLQKLLLDAIATHKVLLQQDHRNRAVKEYQPMPRNTQDGVCRDVAIQTRRSLQKGSKLNLKSRDRSREVSKSLVDHSSQTSSREAHSDEDTEKNLREQITVNVLQRWAEPLEQYLSNVQQFEEELREKWLTPKERQTPTSGAHTGDLESTSETQMTRASSDKVETRPLSNRKYGGAPDKSHLKNHDKSEQENYQPSDLHFQKPRPKHSAYESDSLPEQEYLAAGFRTRNLVEWWPATAKPLQTTKPRSAPSRAQLYTVYDPRALLGKAKQDSGEKTRQKPEWWPALRRPYSASDIEAMHEKDTDKATRKPSSAKIATGYPPRRQKSQKKTTETMKDQCTQACIAKQDDDSLKRTLQIRNARPPSPPPRKNHREEHRKKMDELQKAYGQFQKRDKPRKLRQEQVTISKCKTGHGELHALQGHHDQGPTGITIKEHVCGMITHLKDQVCGIVTGFQPEQELEVASSLLHQIEMKRNQAGVHSAQPEFPKVVPVVELHNEEHQDKKTRKKNRSNSYLQRGIERLADKLIDQAVNEVASELAEFCETVADQMYLAEFMT